MPLRYLILMQSMLIVTIGQLSNYLYTPSMPAMVMGLHTYSTCIQLSLSLPLIMYGLAQLLYGALSDYYGRRSLVIIGLSIFTLGSIFTVFAHSIGILLAGRIIQGLGIGAVGLTRVINRDVFSGPEFLKMSSYITMILAAVPLLAPLLGGYIQDYIGWRGNFVFLFIYAIGILTLVSLKLPETNHNRHVGHPTAKSLLQGYVWVLRNKRFVAFMTCSLLAFSGESLYAIIAPFIIQTELGYSAVAYGWLSLTTIGGFLIGSIIASRISHKVKPEQMLKVGSIIILFASFLMLALSWQLNAWVILLPMAIFMLGMSMVSIPCSVAAMSLFTNRIGVAGAVYGSGIMVGAGLISAFSTQFHLHTQRPLALILCGITVMVAIIYCKFIRAKPLPTATGTVHNSL